jgi:hypothetical protein
MLRHRATSPTFRPRVFAIAAEFGTVRAACRAMGIHPSTYYRWTRQLDRHGPEMLEQCPCRNLRLPRIEREELRFLSRRDRRPHRGHPRPLPGRWCSWAPTAACGSGAGRAPPKPGRSAGRGGHHGREPRRGQGQADRRPSKTRAGRRTVGRRPSSSVSWRHTLPPRSGPAATSSPPPVGGRCGVPGLRARIWVPAAEAAGLQGLRIHDLRHTAVALWIAAGATPKEVAVRGAHLGQHHLDPPWTATATRRSPAGRGGPVPSSKGLDYGVRQRGREPQDARSPG